MYKTSLNIGTLAGITAFGLFLGLYYIGISPLGGGKLLGFWIPIVAVIWVNLRVRDQVLGGSMTFLQAFLSGMITILTWCTFKGFCMYIFMTSFHQHVIADYLSLLKDIGNNPFFEQVDMDELAVAATPWNLMIGDISNNTLYGSFIVFIVAFITKRNPK